MATFDAVSSASFTDTDGDSSHTFGNVDDLSLVVAISFGSLASGSPPTVPVVSSVEVDPDGSPVALTEIGTIHQTAGGDEPRVELWGLSDATAFKNMTETIRVILSEAPTDIAGFGAISIKDANNGFGTFASAVDECGSIDPSITVTSAVDEFCIDAVSGRRQDDPPDTGQTERFRFTGAELIATGSTEPGAATSIVMGWSCFGGGAPHWAQGGVSVLNAAGGAAASLPHKSHGMKHMLVR